MIKVVPTKTVMLTAGLLLAAGFETTSSLVAATLYLLLRNPRVLEKVTHEVRSSFQSQEEISFSRLDNLPYMIACLTEALRWYPPVAGGMQRQVMKGGASIAGHFVAEEVSGGLTRPPRLPPR
jgi:cytochrome P450